MFRVGGTSISDYSSYTDVCQRAATTDFFNKFRADPAYQEILEHVSPDEGRELVGIVAARFADYSWEDFKRNDDFGGAQLADCGAVKGISPTTARYVKVLSDLEVLFGSLSGRSIVEIGGGYGGQARVVFARFSPSSYRIIDLAEPAALARRYLDCFGLSEVETTAEIAPQSPKPDLVISNYALSEVRRSVQMRYFDACLKGSARGFMLWNAQVWPANMKRNDDAPMGDEEIAHLVGGRIIRQAPFLTTGDIGNRNTLVVWGA